MKAVRVLVHGAGGTMGKMVASCGQDPKWHTTITCGIDVNGGHADFPIHQNAHCVTETFDVIIDFSHPACVENLLVFSLDHQVPLVLCTTGLTEELQHKVDLASKQIPIFQSGNMSYGIALLQKLLHHITPQLDPHFDIEIVEKHHKNKVDAPSGTALMLAKTIQECRTLGPGFMQYGRQPGQGKRIAKEIGMHAIRGGTIVGEHEVLFCGDQEIITLGHQALSREVFAQGALRAAAYLMNKGPGLYNMHTLIAEEEPYATL